MGTDIPKQYQVIAGKPILVHTMEQFQRCGGIDCIVVVAAQAWQGQILRWREEFGLSKLRVTAPAGENRQRSILNGLRVLRPFLTGEGDGVVVQDAARPLTSGALIGQLLQGLREAPCVLPALPVTDTAYISRDGRWVDGLLDRTTLYAGQAPEAFRYQDYLRLYEETPLEELDRMSGSCQLPYSRGWQVKMIDGEGKNIKITYPSDLELCEKLLREREMAE